VPVAIGTWDRRRSRVEALAFSFYIVPVIARHDSALGGQLRNGLAQVAVVVHDLVDGEPVLRQLAPMLRGGDADVRGRRRATAGRPGDAAAAYRVGRLLDAERLDELGEEERYSELERSSSSRTCRCTRVAPAS